MEFPEKSCTISVAKPRESADLIQQKKLEHPIQSPTIITTYKSFEEFNLRISKLKIAPWKIEYCSTYTKIFVFDNIHSVPYLEIYVLDTFDLNVRCLLWNLNAEHQIFIACGKSIQNTTLSLLINVLNKFYLCPGMEHNILLNAMKSLNLNSNETAILHSVPKNYDPTHAQTPVQQSTYYRSKICSVLVQSKEMCLGCRKEEGKFMKAEKRKTSTVAVPAKSKAPISQTSVKRLQLTLSNFRMENEDLKHQIKQLQDELNSSSVKISKD